MSASADQLPPAQREVVEYMQKMMQDPEALEAPKGAEAEKVDA